MITMMFLSTFSSALLCVLLFLKNPSNIATIVSTLTVLFGLVPGILFRIFGINDFYSFRAVVAAGGYIFNYQLTEYVLFVMSAITLSFAAGSWAALSSGTSRIATTTSDPASRRVRTVKQVGTLIWIALLLTQMANSGVEMQFFFLPVVRTGSYEGQSGYIYTAIMTLPIVLMIVSATELNVKRSHLIFFFVLGLLACLTTHQRREIITLLLATVGLIAFLPRRNVVSTIFWDTKRNSQRQRKVAVIGLLFGLLAVPMTWYFRVWLTNTLEGQSINAFEIRGLLEVLVGSPATAFPSFTLVADFVQTFGAQPFRLPLQLIATPIPRGIWEGKPTDIDTTLQLTYNLIENPSSFWLGELFFNYDVGAIFVAAPIGYVLARWHRSLSQSASLLHRGTAVLLFAYSVTLFKNGFYTSINRFTVAIILLYLASRFIGLAGVGTKAKDKKAVLYDSRRRATTS